ncbi:hypothetical protein EDC01DRAFT_660044 [Geopyxis carbonaria]|nr:hypothetical protein EDC01DRAFT_660044 [Geopyxis carbonaria]
MTKYSFLSFDTMFNRLPMYSRPKEPAIGEPVLIQSTNERLSGRPGIQIVGLDGLPKPMTQAFGGSSSFDIGKGLPQIPSTTSFMDEDFRPPVPDRDQRPRSSSPSTRPSRREPLRAETHPAFRSNSPPRNHNVARKPTPLNVPSQTQIWDGRGYTSTQISSGGREARRRGSSGALLQKAHTSVGEMRSEVEAVPQQKQKQGGFALGNLVKGKATGRRKLSLTTSPDKPVFPDLEHELETPVTTVRPANLVSIDDWLAGKEGHHKRSNTVSTVATQYTQYGGRGQDKPSKLQLRQSVFAPFRPPEGMISESTDPMPSMPAIPAHFLTNNTPLQTQRPPRGESLGTHPALLQPPPSPPATPPKAPENESPPDRVSRLEEEQRKLEERKRKLRKDTWELEQLLPPNPSTHNPAVREQMKTRLGEINQAYADVEKALHDVGMRLHRAYRRLDKMTGNGPTHLWVSRVTAGED